MRYASCAVATVAGMHTLDHRALDRVLRRAQKRQRHHDRMITVRVYAGVIVALLGAATGLILALR